MTLQKDAAFFAIALRLRNDHILLCRNDETPLRRAFKARYTKTLEDFDRYCKERGITGNTKKMFELAQCWSPTKEKFLDLLYQKLEEALRR